MIIFLYGPDDYRREEKRRAITAEFVRKHGGITVRHFNIGAEGALDVLEEFVHTQSIFEPMKLAVLEGSGEADGTAAARILKSCRGESHITLLISEHDELPKKEFGFLHEKKAGIVSQHFPELSGEAWEHFVKEQALKRSLRFTPDALQYLSQAYEGDTWRLVTALEKLSFLEKTTLGRVDLESLGAEIAPEFWELLNALKTPDRSRRLLALEKIFSARETAGKVFNILAYASPATLPLFAEYDRAVKGGKLDYEEVLLDLAIR